MGKKTDLAEQGAFTEIPGEKKKKTVHYLWEKGQENQEVYKDAERKLVRQKSS